MIKKKKIMSSLPYKNISQENNIINRCIQESTDDLELKWHRDLYNRHIKVISGSNWYLQLENEIPILLEKNKMYYIQKDQWHRVIKGNEDLILEIIEEK
jgi:hypothetical protein